MGDWYSRPASDRPALRHQPPRGPGRRHRAPTQQLWFRADGKLPDDPLLHVCVADLRVGHDAARLDLQRPPAQVGGRQHHGRAASTTPCGSIARSGPTSGCCTTSSARRRRRRAGLAEGRSSRTTGDSRCPSCRRVWYALSTDEANRRRGRAARVGGLLFGQQKPRRRASNTTRRSTTSTSTVVDDASSTTGGDRCGRRTDPAADPATTRRGTTSPAAPPGHDRPSRRRPTACTSPRWRR